jgi:hypothetical protein
MYKYYFYRCTWIDKNNKPMIVSGTQCVEESINPTDAYTQLVSSIRKHYDYLGGIDFTNYHNVT